MFVSLRAEPIRKSSIYKVTGHNHRVADFVKDDARIDPSRTHLNEHIIKTADTIEEAVQNRLDEANTSPPKHAIYTAQELVLSASPEYFRPEYDRDDPEGKGKYDPERLETWKNKTMEWLEKEYGRKNLVDVVLHVDETTPHIHAVVVPIVEVECKKRRTKAQKEANEPAETYKKEKYKRTHFFDRGCLFRIQEEYGNYMNEIGLYRGIPKKLTKKKHKDTKDWHHEQYLKTLTKLEIKSPEMEFSMDTTIEGFKMPKSRLFESGSSYRKRCEEQIKEMVKEQIGEEYSLRIKEYEEKFLEVKDVAESLYEELIEERAKNDALMKAMDRFVEVNSELFSNKNNKKMAFDMLKTIRDETIKQNDPEGLTVEKEYLSDNIKASRKSPNHSNYSPSQ